MYQLSRWVCVCRCWSAIATYFSPSDVSGIGWMLCECIRSMNKWWNGHERHDCVFVEHDEDIAGFHGMFAAQVYTFIKFKYNSITYPCAIVKFFSTIGDSPCPNTGMWMVWQDDEYDLVHIDAIVRAAHLIEIPLSLMDSYHLTLLMYSRLFMLINS